VEKAYYVMQNSGFAKSASFARCSNLYSLDEIDGVFQELGQRHGNAYGTPKVE
jgi:hypothetical protein